MLGVAVYGPQAFAFRGTSPRTHWEAAHQGYAVAEDERQRPDLGSAPIRDVPETLATLRVRIARLALPESVSRVYLHTPETGALVVVDRNSSPEERRFWMVHGLAHLLFEPERRWLVCSRDDMNRRHEVRANAFAGRFLMPRRGVERYLHSIGRDTMGSSLGGVLEVFSDRAAVPKDKSRVRVSGRSRRGGREFNTFELSQVADYFGVTRSLAAHMLGNLNAVHHFDFTEFLRRSCEGLAGHGRLFVYTRVPEHNARNIWGRYFPGFAERETRLLTLGDLHGAIEDTPGLRFAGATCFRYRRRATLDRLVEQAESRHYSTFSLYDPDEFEDALATFRAVVGRRCADTVEWFDENVLIHAVHDLG